MTRTIRVLMFLACLAVCAVAQADSINPPRWKSTLIPAMLSATGMLGVVAVAARRRRRERQSPKPLTDTGRRRLKVAAVCSWLSMVPLGVLLVLVLVMWWPSWVRHELDTIVSAATFFTLLGALLGAGFVAAIAGYVISIRERGNLVLASVPPLIYLLPVVLLLAL
jgi:hypothetical protein